MKCISFTPVELKYDPNSKSEILRSIDKVAQINKQNSTPVKLSPTYLKYLEQILLPEMIRMNTTQEAVMKKIGLSSKNEHDSTLIMMRQVQFSLKYLTAALNDMKTEHYYNIHTADSRGRVYPKAYLSHINAK